MIRPITFNTTLKCSGCLAAVKPGLDNLPNLESWEADLGKPLKTVTIFAEENAIPDVLNVFETAGYHAQVV